MNAIDAAAGGKASDPHRLSRALDSLGRLVIPAEVRRELELTTGDQLAITLRGGNIMLSPLRDVSRECGRPK